MDSYVDLRKPFRHYLRLMRMFGIYEPPDQTPVERFGGDDGVRLKLRRFGRVLFKIYKVVILTLMWLMVLRYTTTVVLWRPFLSKQTTYNLSMMLYCIQSALDATVFYRMFKPSGRFQDFLEQWVAKSKRAGSLNCCQTQIVVMVKRVVRILLFMYLSLHVIAALSFQHTLTSGKKELRMSINFPFGEGTLWWIFTAIGWLVVSTVWSFSLIVFVAAVKCLSLQFDAVAKRMNEVIRTSDGFPSKLWNLKALHDDLCSMVDNLNVDLQHLLSFCFLLNIIILLITGYSLTKLDPDLSDYLMFGLMFTLSMFKMTFLSLMSGHLHTKIHKPLSSLYMIKKSHVTLEDVFGLNLFMEKLKESSMGLTAMKIITVKRGTLYTLLGIYLTYFFVIIQFSL